MNQGKKENEENISAKDADTAYHKEGCRFSERLGYL
jgi:hypothetical protein